MDPVIFIADVPFDVAHLVLAALFLFAGGGLLWLRGQTRTAALLAASEAAAREDALARARDALREVQERAETATARAVEAERALAVAEARALEERQQFTAMAQDAVRAAHRTFTEQASETFQRHNQAAETSLKTLLTPINQTFEAFRQRVEALEKVRTEDKSAIFEQVRAINDQLTETRNVTGKLVTALSAPQGGGRWGEESLRNVLEMAGLSMHADFIEQAHGETDTRRQRPDVVIRMPGGREIVVDAKVSVEDFLLAAETAGSMERDAHLAGHARKMREHVKRLAAKEYWKDFSDRVDFVAMYVPGENFYAAALQHDRDLFDFAARNRVLIVTPSTLIALAKAVAYGWRQEEAAGNAREAAQLGKDLYDALRAMGTHLDRVGKSLGQAVGSYNAMVGSVERNVLPKARRFEALQITQSGVKPLSDPAMVEDPVRRPVPGGELVLGHDAPDAAGASEGDDCEEAA